MVDERILLICVRHLSRIGSNLIEFNPRLLDALAMIVPITPMKRQRILALALLLTVPPHVHLGYPTFDCSHEFAVLTEILKLGKTNPDVGCVVALSVVCVFMSDEIAVVNVNVVPVAVEIVSMLKGGVDLRLANQEEHQDIREYTIITVHNSLFCTVHVRRR